MKRLAVATVALFFCWMFAVVPQAQSADGTPLSGQRSISGPSGKLFEKHVQKGCPEVDIYMHGFLDSSFDAYLVRNGKAELLFRSLPCLKSEFGNSTNKVAREKPANRVAPSDHLRMYAVYWSTNGTRLAIAWQGYLVVAYDIVSKQRIVIDSNPAVRGEYMPMDALIARFLAGVTVTTNEVADVKKQTRRKARSGGAL